MWTNFVNWVKGLFGYAQKEVSYVEPYWETGEKAVVKTFEDITREAETIVGDVEKEVEVVVEKVKAKRKTAKRAPKTKANTTNTVVTSA